MKAQWKWIVAGVAFGWMLLVAATWAEASEGSSHSSGNSSGNSDDEYGFSWLDPEKKIYVLQNRRYLKANHFEISAMAGAGLSNPYRTEFDFDPRLAYFLSEAWGVEFFYTFHSNSENNTFGALETASPSALPLVRQISNQMGAVVNWAPFYSKINVFNKILYFDWYFQGGAGQVVTALDLRTLASAAPNYQTQNLLGIYLATGQQIHLNDNLSLRIHFGGVIYSAQIFGNNGANAWYSSYNFELGLGYRL